DILYGEGISSEGDLLDLGVEKNVIEKSGTWLSFGSERMGQGRENARAFLKENKDIREKLENALRKKMEIPGPGQTQKGSATGSGSKWAREQRAGGKAATEGGGRSGRIGCEGEAG